MRLSVSVYFLLTLSQCISVDVAPVEKSIGSIAQLSARPHSPQRSVLGSNPSNGLLDAPKVPILPASGPRQSENAQIQQQIYEKLVNIFRHANVDSLVRNINVFTLEANQMGMDLDTITTQAIAEACWRDALEDPLSPLVHTWIKHRQAYLLSIGKESQANDELETLQRATYVATQRDGFQRVIQSPLSKESQLFFYNMIAHLKQLKVTPSELDPLLDTFFDALFAAVAAHPLNLESEEAMQYLYQIQKIIKYPDQHLESVMQNFEKRKLFVLKSVHRTSIVPTPIRITMDSKPVIITGRLGAGGYGATFDAYLASQPNVPLVLKIMYDSIRNVDRVVQREKRALLELNRFVASDDAHRMILFKKIEGVSLDHLLSDNNPLWERKFLAEYMDLGQDFYEQTGMIHGDIRPANVIVDKDHRLHLIDFGMTLEAPHRKDKIAHALQVDWDNAEMEYELILARGKALAARKNPHAKNSRNDIDYYATLLEMSDRPEKAARWREIFQQLYG